jgi:NB-ARC domain
MNVAEVINIADRLVFQSRHKHLNDLERAIIEGVSEGKTSVQIANDTRETPYTEVHVNEVASKLWKELSVFLDEKVTKKNFKSMIERYHSSIVQSHNWKVGNINFCSEPNRGSREEDLISDSRPFPHYPRDIPPLVPLYGRTDELTSLKQWIVEERCRSIVIYGTYGIGKTALARQLVEDIGDKFDAIIWYSLEYARSFDEFIERNLLPYLNIDKFTESPSALEDRLSLAIDCLRDRRYLIVLDDVEEIFRSGELAGSYAEIHHDYRDFFRRIRQTNHQSCLIQLSGDKPSDIDTLEEGNSTFRTLRLGGLDKAGREIFRAKALKDEDSWEKAIASYYGNPKYLEIVATSIKKSFEGKVSCISGLEQIFLPD